LADHQGQILRGRNGQVNESWGIGGVPEGLLLKNRHCTHPMKEDVKKKRFSTPLGKMQVW
jgi:hypothetical protein